MEVVGTKRVGRDPSIEGTPSINVVVACVEERLGVALLGDVLVEILTTNEELIVVIEGLGTSVEDVLSPRQLAAYEALVLIDEGLHALTQLDGLLENVVLRHTTTHVLVADVTTDHQGLRAVVDGTILVAT